MHTHIREIGAERRFHLAAHPLRQRPSAGRGEPKLPGLDRERATGAGGRAAKAGVGGPGGRPPKGVVGGPGWRAAGLAWIRGGAATLGWTEASFGWPPKNDPWITFAVMIRSALNLAARAARR